MNLADATPEDMANELSRRGVNYVLIAQEPNGRVSHWSPPKISGEANEASGDIFRLVRDYLNFLDNTSTLSD